MPIPDFIKSLRAKIGTDLLQVPVATVMAYDQDGRRLLVQDKPSGLWGVPSGIIDPHELPADAAVRETWEEAGVFVELTHTSSVYLPASTFHTSMTTAISLQRCLPCLRRG